MKLDDAARRTERAAESASEVGYLKDRVSSLEKATNDRQLEVRRLSEELRRRQSELGQQNYKIQSLEQNLRDAKEYAGPNVIQSGYQYGGLAKSESMTGISSQEQKNHVIKVLEHESKVYRFEKNLVSSMSGGTDFDIYSEQGNPRRTRKNDF